jgi:hypothetical protein
MKNQHDHAPQCEHRNLKYCKRCDQPHCTDCGRNWNAYRVINNQLPSWWPYKNDPMSPQITWTAPNVTSSGTMTILPSPNICQHR